jgi:hypothetical protein
MQNFGGEIFWNSVTRKTERRMKDYTSAVCGLGSSSSGQFRVSESVLLVLNPGFTARVRNRWGKVAGGILFCVGSKMGTEHRLFR